MNRFIYLLLLFPFLFAACINNEKKDDANSIKNASMMMIKSFSELNSLDTFRLNLRGTKPKEMTLAFTITNCKGKQIYYRLIKGDELLGSTDPNVDLRKEKDQIKFLSTIASQFFSEDNFLEPAVMPDGKSDNYTPDPKFYNELKATKLNGFKYRLGKENNIYIAWSVKEHKVKVYYNCC